LDWRVLGFSTVISLMAGILFGLAPAFRSTRVDVATSLKERAGAIAGPRFGIGKALVVLQVALSLLLMVGAGLLLRTLLNLSRIDPGFDRENVLLFWILPTTAGYDGPEELRLYEKVLQKFNSIPGVLHAGMARHNLMQGGFHSAKISGVETAVNAIAPGFFATMRVPVLAGRDFSVNDKEKTPKVAIVNQRFARYHFGAENPLGKRFVIDDHPGKPAVEVVGVICDVRYHGLREESRVPAEEVYIPFTQAPRDMLGQMVFALRTSAAPMNMLAPARRAIQAIDKNLPLVSPTTQAQEVQDSIGEERSLAALTEFFSVLALLLACIGLYGVMSYTVARRTGEFGLRLALGAQRSDVYRLVLRESTRLLMVGIAVGILGALAATRYLASVLYGIEPFDPATFATVAILLAAIAMFASWLPARRATRVDPLVALRYE
jgi:predicted permease